MAHQDWAPVVLKKSGHSKPKTAHGLAKAKAKGTVETQKKYGGGGNKHSQAAVYARKLEEEDADFKHAQISTDFKKALMQARQAKKMSQKQLAQKIHEKATVINDYEAGRAIPNPQIISKLNRALGVRLPKIKKPKKAKD